jgi:hypothetical protein
MHQYEEIKGFHTEKTVPRTHHGPICCIWENSNTTHKRIQYILYNIKLPSHPWHMLSSGSEHEALSMAIHAVENGADRDGRLASGP